MIQKSISNPDIYVYIVHVHIIKLHEIPLRLPYFFFCVSERNSCEIWEWNTFWLYRCMWVTIWKIPLQNWSRTDLCSTWYANIDYDSCCCVFFLLLLLRKMTMIMMIIHDSRVYIYGISTTTKKNYIKKIIILIMYFIIFVITWNATCAIIYQIVLISNTKMLFSLLIV